ncbi:hypothetical protein YERSI8AC_180144 [Enterobacterales bacterium 8AC]|nr:hypothetical protein YERSI8AC_180144 [Enterobacterales bacterium 8AC]
MAKKNGGSDALRQRQLLTQLIQQGKQEEAWKKIRARLLFAPNDVWFIVHRKPPARLEVQ